MVEEPTLNHINVWQQDAIKSLTVQLATLHSVEDKYDVLCIQEPYFDFQSLLRATGIWTSVYPSNFNRAVDGPAGRLPLSIQESPQTVGPKFQSTRWM